MEYKSLRKKYPRFIYENYGWRISGRNLEIFFDFKIEPDISFRPKILIKNVDKKRVKKIGERVLDNLVFHLGLIEIPSYWKATCSPIIEVRAGYLEKEQIKWWKGLILKGMGQYFYENKIDFTEKNFLKIKSEFKDNNYTGVYLLSLSNKFLIPVGRGKDSIVTLEKLKKEGKKIGCFLVNPSQARKNTVRIGKVKNLIIVKRKTAPELLELNKKGFLNGHTPITAALSFLAVFCAVLFDYKNIAFSNEKSADEGNLEYLGKTINHQWSKSSEFERKFRHYSRKYLVKNINYFSFLRKHTELEISKIFTRYPQYFPVFSSCNVVQRIASPPSLKLRRVKWCGNCPKCLFVYAALYPYLKRETLLKIFGKDIFENKKLLSTMKSLMGQGSHKPFECVGAYKESRLAFALSQKKAAKTGKIPFLLQSL